MRKFKYSEFDGEKCCEVTVTEFDIIDDYFPYWSKRMKAVGKEDMISIERCIDDYIVVNWAEELK